VARFFIIRFLEVWRVGVMHGEETCKGSQQHRLEGIIMSVSIREPSNNELWGDNRSKNEASNHAPKNRTGPSSKMTAVPERSWTRNARQQVSGGDVAVAEMHSCVALAPKQSSRIVQDDICTSTDSDFNYASVPISVARFLKGQATRIRQYAAKSIIQIGKDLTSAKHFLSHGQFVRWVETEVGIPVRTAQAYMRAAQWASGKGATVALLPPSLLYVLSASSTPKEVIEEIITKAEAGERITLSTIRAKLRALRDASRYELMDGCIAGLPVMHGDDCDEGRRISSGEAALLEAVRILVRALSRSDLARIKKIMTSNDVLRQPNLSRNMEIAFSAIADWQEIEEPRRGHYG
jgi:hypothetical protein